MTQIHEQYDLSEYKVISIEDRHKLAIVHLVNSIISEPPLLEDLKESQNAVWRLGRLIAYYEKSFLCGQNLKIPMVITDQNICDISNSIRNWLCFYYNCDSVIDSLKLEDGNEEEIAMASLLILNVYYQLRNSLSSIKAYFDLGWIYLAEFDEQLDAMWRSDKLVQFLQNELECVRNERNVERDKLFKAQKELTNVKTKLQQSKATIERLKGKGDRPGPKSKKKGRYDPDSDPFVRKRGRPRKVQFKVKTESDSEIDSDTPPAPGTPVLLSSSGTGSSCRFCGKWFNESYKLNRHMVIHSGVKPFTCDWPGCGRPFDSNYKLQRHRRCHTGERPFPCTLCDKRFTRSDKLREHQRLHLKKKTKEDDGKTDEIENNRTEENETMEAISEALAQD